MLPIWLKSEDAIYNMLQKSKDRDTSTNINIDTMIDGYNKMLETNDGSMLRGVSCFYRDAYLDIPSGVEVDNNSLKPISIIVANWERHYYIPFVIEMYHSQDYPKNLIEILIVDDDSTDKQTVLNIIKDQTILYPDLKIRFIQNYVNKNHNSAKRLNIGIRHSSHDIIIINGTDVLPLGTNYLRGICYAHNRFKNSFCIGISIGFQYKNISNLNNIFECPCIIIGRLDHDNAVSFDRELVSKIRGYDEKHIGWGGLESIYQRYMSLGGKCFVNTSIFSAMLPNFPIPLPPGIRTDHTGGYWQDGIVINDENWGMTEKMEEIYLY